MNTLSTTTIAPEVIADQTQWHKVAKELEGENIKLMSYDKTLFAELGDVRGKNILDYGAGPGVLASVLKRLGANVKAYDINAEMREKSAEKIGIENVYERLEDIPKDPFDVVICNLVLCIVPEQEAKNILSVLKSVVNPSGQVYIGFCNPKIHNVPESQLDFRFYSGKTYSENHSYRKIKKEGIYEIMENHRPVEWYARAFHEAGLVLLDIILTPQYQIRNDIIHDFIIFKLAK